MLSIFHIVALAFLTTLAFAQSWKHYPLVLETDPAIVFPSIEGAQYQDMGDSWFMTAQVQGQTTGKKYQIVDIFDRNYITAAILNFYQASIFDYGSGKYVTYTDYDLPGIDLIDMKFQGAPDHLDLTFSSTAETATWTTISPFRYNLHCPGTSSDETPFLFDITADFTKKPVPYGASTLRGDFTFYAQKDTISYFIVRPNITGTLTMDGVTESISGNLGHMDRQVFPLYSGIFTPTGRQHSHEWRQINFPDGTDLAIWRQFDRVNNNTIIPTSGITASPPGSENSVPSWISAIPNDLTVEYLTYTKYPRSQFHTLIPPPSANMYLPADHIIRSKAANMELQCTYVNKSPAVTLPIEYYEGPATWNGTYQGRQVSGVGIFESTLALYRDWELAKVLLDSVVHLPEGDFSAAMGRDKVAEVVSGVNEYVSSDVIRDNRIGARIYIDQKLLPALQSMVPGQDKDHVLEIAQDLRSSLDLVLQF